MGRTLSHEDLRGAKDRIRRSSALTLRRGRQAVLLLRRFKVALSMKGPCESEVTFGLQGRDVGILQRSLGEFDGLRRPTDGRSASTSRPKVGFAHL